MTDTIPLAELASIAFCLCHDQRLPDVDFPTFQKFSYMRLYLLIRGGLFLQRN